MCVSTVEGGSLICDVKSNVPKSRATYPVKNIGNCIFSKSKNEEKIQNAKLERSRHVDMRVHFLRDMVCDGVVKLIKCAGMQNVADMLTKSLPKPAFHKHREAA